MNFNQDFTCISYPTGNGYRIFNCEPFGKCYSNVDCSVSICEMLFSTSLVALVGSGEQPNFSPRKLQIVNTKRQSIICELNFVTSVLSVRLNRKRLVVVLEDNIYIYDISNMKLLHTIDTCSNPKGIIALSPSTNYIAYPANTTTGQILIFDTVSLQSVNIIQAHKSPVSTMAFNHAGTMIATSSDKGTVIRVFSVPEAKRLYQLRRGSTPAKIFHISFNMQSNLVTVSSENSTIHIFKLFSLSPSNALISGYLPEFVSEMWEPIRDFAHIKTNSNGSAIAALSPTLPQVMVVTADGYFQLYSINLETGGECQMLKQYSLNEDVPIVEGEVKE